MCIGAVLAGVLLVGSACSTESSAPETPQATTSVAAQGVAVPTVTGAVAQNLSAPWSVVPLNGAEQALISERDSGRILLLDVNSGDTEQVGQVPDLETAGEGGLMGLALTENNKKLFAMYTAADGNKVVEYAWSGQDLGTPKDVITGIPRAQFHDGGRLAIGPDSLLYIATGDAGTPDAAQDLDNLAGKILRLDLDGAVPADNPFSGSPVYSLGHRNVQGLAFDDNKNLWASEFGESDFDELNLITAGSNYGWPIHEGPSDDPDFVSPKASWSPTATSSPSGIAYMSGSIWVAALRGETLWQVPIDGTEAGEPISRFADEFGRLRDVAAAGSDELWVLTNNTDTRGTPKAQDDQIIGVQVTSG
ncbi:MAG: PQQ-dependent sugar dehydrogenase [Actinomycetia bacterium]|nr:PQQ-dependent sugar dehydrogenase [Actinomycetes bacterium]